MTIPNTYEGYAATETEDLPDPDYVTEDRGFGSAYTAPEPAAPVPEAEVDTDTDEDDDEGSSAGARKGGKPSAAKANRTLIRRTAQKALEVQAASALHRDVAAALLGATAEPAELTVAIMTAGRQTSNPLADINEIVETAKENPMMAGVAAASMERNRLKAVWTILHTVGAVPSQVPASDMKAAITAATAVTELDQDTLAELAIAGELIKRS